MSLNISLDQHRLYTTPNGEILCEEEGTFLIYDLLSAKTVAIPLDQMAIVVPFLSQRPFVTAGQVHSSVSNTELGTDTNLASTSNNSAPSSIEVWVKNSGKPSAHDILARDKLVKLYGSDKFQKLFTDKKSNRKDVWDMLAAELMTYGFHFGERNPGKVCSQKWRNMEGETLKCIAAAGPNNSGGGQTKKPDYFDEVHDVLKDKAKACPKKLVDSLDYRQPSCSSIQEKVPVAKVNSLDKNPEEELSDDEEERKEAAASDSPFLKVKSSSKPKESKVKNNEIMEFLKEDAKKRDKQGENLLKFLENKSKKDNKLKRSFLGVLQQIAGKKKKTKSSDEDTSESDEEKEGKD